MNEMIEIILNDFAEWIKAQPGGKECNHTLHPENAVNFTQLTYNGAYVEIPRPQQLTGSWEPIEGTDEVMCSQCFSRLKNKTSHGQTFKICPMCGIYINNEQISIKNNKIR